MTTTSTDPATTNVQPTDAEATRVHPTDAETTEPAPAPAPATKPEPEPKPDEPGTEPPGPTAITRPVQAIVMLLLGGAVMRSGLTGMSLRYVKEGLRPFLIIAGLLLIAAAVMTLWYEFHPADHSADADHLDHPDDPADHPDDRHHDDGHGHAHHEPRVGWLLILPVLALLLVAPPALGSYAAGQSGSVLTAQNADSDYPPLPKGDPAELDLLDYASRAVFDQGKTLTGRSIRLTGFITPGADGQPMLARIVLACCAADGRPIKVALTGNAPTSVQADTWVTIVGTYSPQTTKDPVNNAVVPYIEVTTWEQIATPEQPYE